jgi:hypothetical protein
MSLTISLTPDAEARLKERARAEGKNVVEYVEELIARELMAPITLVQAAEPFARAVDESGISDDEFTSILNEARDAVRRDRHPKRA